MNKILIYDIETVKGISLISVYSPVINKFYDFRVDRLKNNINTFDTFSKVYKNYTFVGYNNFRFDAQVVEFILRN